MNQKEFEDLVEGLETYSRDNRSAYPVRVFLLAALGYLFLVTIPGSEIYRG